MTGMSWLSAGKLAMCFVFVVLTAGLVHSFEQEQEYLAPSFPSLSMDDPTSVEEVMPYARQAARNRAAAFGGGLGLSTAGETIALVIGGCNNPHIVEAMRRALVEREIAPVVLLRGPNSAIIWDYETHRGSYSDEGCTRESSIPGMTVTEAGFTEGRDPGTVPYPVRLRNWFRSERPDLFQRVYPNRSLEPEPVDEEPNLGFSGEGNDVIIAYLEDHPEVDGVYSGGTWYQEAGNFGPFADKWRGTTFWDRFTIISNVPSYPADVWALTEEKNIEAIAFASRFHLTDPEGTDLEDEISPDLARRWASGIYERGHNMLGPNMATGRFARSTVSYPAMSGEWIPRSPISTPTGVIAGTTNHVGYHPLMKMYYEEGYLTRVEDGGLYGDLARMWLSEPGYPNIHTAQYHITMASPASIISMRSLWGPTRSGSGRRMPICRSRRSTNASSRVTCISASARASNTSPERRGGPKPGKGFPRSEMCPSITAFTCTSISRRIPSTSGTATDRWTSSGTDG